MGEDMGNLKETNEAYYGSRNLHVICVEPERPYCTVCPYALIDTDFPEDPNAVPRKVFCLLSNCYVWKLGV